MKATIFAKSSSGAPYEVNFLAEGKYLLVFCHCQAGSRQWVCKHKLALILGNADMLYDPSQVSLLKEIQTLPQFASLKTRVKRYNSELLEIEAAKEQVLKMEKRIKARMGKDLTLGGYAI